MVKTFAKTRNYALLGIVLIIAILAVGTNSNPVLAQTQPCTAQLGYPTVAAQQYYYGYYGSNVQVTVPVSASCPFYTGQLYAVGTAYSGYNSNIGSANTGLTAIYGNSFSGQLQFSLPASTQTVQFSVSIYNMQTGYYQPYYGGTPLAVTSATYVINPNNYQSTYPYNPTYPTYPTYPSNPTYPTYPTHPTYPTYPSYPYYPGYNNGGYYNNRNNGGYYYYYRNGGYYNYYYNRGYYNNYNQQCNGPNNYCTHSGHR